MGKRSRSWSLYTLHSSREGFSASAPLFWRELTHARAYTWTEWMMSIEVSQVPVGSLVLTHHPSGDYSQLLVTPSIKKSKDFVVWQGWGVLWPPHVRYLAKFLVLLFQQWLYLRPLPLIFPHTSLKSLPPTVDPNSCIVSPCFCI